jgi:glycosyltransferase involved in cell wall biosynthesis
MSARISVIIPVYNAESHLRQCLTRLGQSVDAPFECIVVDDGSTDRSAAVARHFGALVLSTEGRCGPARARNIGARVARGDILLFIDSDVCAHPETLSQVAAEFMSHPEIDALMGSYDPQPSAPNFMSQYRNLMHHYVHQIGKHEATSFWAGCGAVRKETFLEFGGFDEIYRTPAIEDIEFGYRLAAAGRRIRLCNHIQVTHLKNWSARGMLKTDFFYRALPWSELTLRSGQMPNDLNLRISQRISVALACLLGCLAGWSAIKGGAFFLFPLFVTFFILLAYFWLDYSGPKRQVISWMMIAVVGAIATLAYQRRLLMMIPLVFLAWVALFARHRYAYPYSSWHRRTGVIVGGYCFAVLAFVWIYLPVHPMGTVFLVVLLTLVALNKQFYLFLAGARGKLFALAAIPFHLLYFASSGMAFLLASLRMPLGLGLRSPVHPEKAKAAVR